MHRFLYFEVQGQRSIKGHLKCCAKKDIEFIASVQCLSGRLDHRRWWPHSLFQNIMNKEELK